ncbi:DNA-binding transcriptional regulator YhcF (GntR family) [Dyadobacter sp. BE34]|uniref:DNA-binding transcriptional regulator YhcF (GntR family) n=1 Tax=Dyadobacter fermentans TaxID=94254 RepID=A0ABU1QSR6_9BACT|nr:MULTISPECIES: GntR family transcriptional regulator [Dyadobacter]MDR6804191.1 DNA-binding transcriptional regulator YhcF (GntR family) [Dyadobacter fermentans]MDR7041931.1 DNA-binding transcriptional regulator YhcF (GntR family) [Dyadobacter sp. BE242]MDR7196334.1 DNA-binding transcriptional regulator YhcF (GntR family) [Dyadobacter sp. BE34]MDR7213121.1 DNA-binding transcriptional regulator YhcF (GntR family) [Dyadobacter sp. BE31]MDR7261740.1 DNA-binding transcriptional regulator YhcF (Gn
MEFKDKQAIYLQIADYICEQILLGKWPPGERIPSVRDLASMIEVNPNTVMRTYDFLQNKEIIFNKRGIGYSTDEQANGKILAYRKERFLTTELPEVFKNLYLLDIGIDELHSLYQKFIEENYTLTK